MVIDKLAKQREYANLVKVQHRPKISVKKVREVVRNKLKVEQMNQPKVQKADSMPNYLGQIT
jgi:hypothetical protein